MRAVRENIRAYHFYIDYLRAHKYLKDNNIIARDRKMVNIENHLSQRSRFDTVCCRLLRSAIQHIFPGWAIHKPRSYPGYLVGASGTGYRRYDYNTRIYHWAEAFDENSDQRKYLSVINDSDNGTWAYPEIRNQLVTISTALSEGDYPVTFTIQDSAYQGESGQLRFGFDSRHCGLHKIVMVLPEIKTIIDQAINIYDNRETWAAERQNRLDERRESLNRFFNLVDTESYEFSSEADESSTNFLEGSHNDLFENPINDEVRDG